MPARIAVVGDASTVSAFQAVGVSVLGADRSSAATIVRKLVDEGYGIIFFTEDLLAPLAPVLDETRRSALPSLVPVPSGRAGARAAMMRLAGIVKRAAGADIFLEEK